MKRAASACLFVLVVIIASLGGTPAAFARDTGLRYGLTKQEFVKFAESIPNLPDRVVAIRFLSDSHSNYPGAIGMLMEDNRGKWEILVMKYNDNGAFSESWKSGPLDDAFEVSGPDMLSTFYLGKEQGLIFSGCARHACGGDGIVSLLLYVPSKNNAFTATSIYGKVSYSADLENPKNAMYKGVLDQLLRNQQ